jgi:hypothetical protein
MEDNQSTTTQTNLTKPMTQDINALRNQIEELKAQKEVEQLQAEVAQLQAPPAPQAQAPQVNMAECMAKMEYATDIEQARVRGWAYFLGAYLTGPIFPAMVANRTKCWTPFWVGLGLGVVGLPFAFMDLGIISSVPAAAAGTALMAKKSTEKRCKLGVTSPDEADLLRFNKI